MIGHDTDWSRFRMSVEEVTEGGYIIADRILFNPADTTI